MINGAEYIIKKLNENGFNAYMVGGCVRDTLMGLIPYDYDITTNALPDDIINIFDKTFLTGKKHGTVTVVYNNINYEVTTFRIDGEYINNRKPQNVTFTTSLSDDLKRRDFTINAIAYNKVCGYIDMFDGISDIKNKIIRTVLNPYERFTEDALRILRGIRFSVKFSFEIEKETFDAMKELYHLIKNISVERITSELERMFEIDPYTSVKLLNDINFFSLFNIKITDKKLDQLKKLEKKNFINTLTLIIYDNPDFSEILNILKCSNNTKSTIKALIEGINCEFKDKASVKKFLNKYDVDFYTVAEISQIIGKDMSKAVLWYEEIIKNNECYKLKDLKINGTDLIKLGKDQKNIGKILNVILDMVIENNELNTYENILKKIKDA